VENRYTKKPYDKRRTGKREDFVAKPDRKNDDRNNVAPDEVEGLVVGRNAVKELLADGRDVEKIYVQRGEREGSINLLVGIASERKIPIIELDRAKLDRMSNGMRHQGIVAIASEHNYSTVDEILEYAESIGEAPFVVVLDGVVDPHNLGAIIRSAECMGAHGIIIPKRRAVGLTATVAKASAGAVMHMRVAKVTNLAQTIDELKEKGLWFYAADMDGENWCSVDYDGAVGLVIGSEGRGVSRLVREKCDFIVSMPMKGRINSLNASVAAGILMYEVARQRAGIKAKG
jgi:23S rRNA (guanosine2251-2'-O)-methyltransferase